MRRYQFEQLEPRTLLAGIIPTVPVSVAHWTFDDGSGTVAADTSGNGHDATLSAGDTWVAGNVGTNALAFNGSSTGVATATGPVVDTSASFTVSAWVNLAALSGFQTFVSIAGTNVAGFFLQLRGDTGSFALARLTSDATGSATYVAAPSAPLANTWYHLVGVDDTAAGTLALYVDGQLIGSTNYTANWAATGDTLIGHGFYNGGQVDYVNGSVDDVQFFSSALSAAQVAALDTPAAYPFDEGVGTTAADYSGHGNTLTLDTGASWGAGDIGSNSLAVNGTTTGNAINAAPVLNTALPFSVSAWVNLNSVTGTQTFASIDGANVSGFALQFRADTGKFAFTRLATDSSAAQVFHADATTAPSTGVWYNLIGVNDVVNGKLLLYVNGILQSSVSYSGGWQATGATVIGAGKSGGTRTEFANGLIDEVRFFNSPLSAGAAAIVGTNGSGILTIDTSVTGVTVSPDLFGAFMEDINYGGEGGIYNNEVRNSGFNDSSNHLNAWAAVAGTGVVDTLASDTTSGPTSALTMSGKLTITSGVSASARAGISNSGYFGVAVEPSTTYTATFYAKATAGFTGPLNVTLESTGGTVYASATVASITTGWAKYTVTLTTGAGAPTSSTNLFVISTNSASANGDTIWFGATYLYPPSYNDSPAHLRVDLMEKLADLQPAIYRVPGGNYLEGNDYANRFNWEATIGPVENRPGHMNPWGYWSTDGMGLDEYLQMAELIGSEPVLAVYAGYTLNGSSDTGQTLLDDVTSAVNELHYVLDPVSTTWGALRAANGHPAPYNINYVEIGNEDWSSTYSTRYPLFYDAIKAEFPSLQIIAASTTNTGGYPFDVLDDHYYHPASWFLANSTLYDNAARGSYKIFVGEYASRDGYQTSTMLNALGDAAFLMGLERNSDLVIMSSYAPIWVNVNPGGQQWATDLIGLNNTSSFGSASYYAQQMLNLYHGEQVIGSSVVGATGLQALVTRTDTTYYLTVVNPGGTAVATTVNIDGVSSVSSTGTAYTLSASSSTAVNTISNPTLIVPVTSIVTGMAASYTQDFPAYSLTIIEFSAEIDIPTVAVPAAADPDTVTGTTTNLSVLGDDPAGESNLTYTWSTTGTPPAAVTFSANGTNAAKNTIATFSKAGTYNFSVAITNAFGHSINSSVNVTVNQTLTGAAITPAVMTLAPSSSTQFSAVGSDQFGYAMDTPLSEVTWSIYSGVGTISSAGLYTAPVGGSGMTTIRVVTPTGQAGYANATILSQVAWYPANATSGTTLADASGNGKDATLSGATAFGAGVSGNALNLTGGYASLPTGVVSTLNDFTIAAWVKIDTLSTWSRIFDFGTGTSVNMFLTPRASSTSGTVRFAITTSGGSGEQQINGTSALATGSWQHVAVTLSGNTGTLYVNGVAVGTNTNMTLRPSSLGSTTQNYLGDSQYTADPALLGSIDDFRIIGRALSVAEIQQFIYPTINTAATASSVTSTSALLSVLGADATGGEAGLKYTWSVTGAPPAPVVFSANGTNVAKTTTATFTRAGTYNFLVTVTNAAGYSTTSSVGVTVYSTIAGQNIFYNNSKFDSISDDNAVPTDKQALLPGGIATFANYTSYSRGINGIMVDIQNLANPNGLSAADFQFQVGNGAGWTAAPAPSSISAPGGGGVGSSDRVTIVWSDNAIQNLWLQVTVLADANTGLAAPDVFYFGNAIGESGDNSSNAVVDPQDEIASRTHKTGFTAAAIDNHYDYNRDGKVNATDDLIARHNAGAVLQLISLTVGAPLAAETVLEPLTLGTTVQPVAAAESTVTASYSQAAVLQPPVAASILTGLPTDVEIRPAARLETASAVTIVDEHTGDRSLTVLPDVLERLGLRFNTDLRDQPTGARATTSVGSEGSTIRRANIAQKPMIVSKNLLYDCVLACPEAKHSSESEISAEMASYTADLDILLDARLVRNNSKSRDLAIDAVFSCE